MAQGCWLSPTHINYFLINFCSTLFLLSTHLGKSTSLINLMKFTQTNIFLLINEKKKLQVIKPLRDTIKIYNEIHVSFFVRYFRRRLH